MFYLRFTFTRPWCAWCCTLKWKLNHGWEDAMEEEMKLWMTRADVNLLKKLNWRLKRDERVPFLPPCLDICMSPCKQGEVIATANGWSGNHYWNKKTTAKENENAATKEKLLQTCWELEIHGLHLLQPLSRIFYMWINNVDVEHKQESLDYRSLRKVVNQCEISHLWCQWESRH